MSCCILSITVCLNRIYAFATAINDGKRLHLNLTLVYQHLTLAHLKFRFLYNPFCYYVKLPYLTWLTFTHDVFWVLSDGLYTTNYWSFSFVVNSNFTSSSLFMAKIMENYTQDQSNIQPLVIWLDQIWKNSAVFLSILFWKCTKFCISIKP